MNFWYRHLLDTSLDKGSAVLRLPSEAKIQTGERDVYPWANECKTQVDNMGSAALAYKAPSKYIPKATLEDFLRAVDDLRELVAHNVQAIEFQSRRPGHRTIKPPSGAELD